MCGRRSSGQVGKLRARGLRAWLNFCVSAGLALLLATFAPPAARAATTADILEPQAGGALFITPPGLVNPPNLVRLARVAFPDTVDAVAYRIELFGPTPAVYDLTEFVAGDDVVGTLLLGPNTLPSPYEIRCLALDATGMPIGDWSPYVPIEIVALTPQPFTPVVSQSASGVVMADLVNIPFGVTLSVETGFTLLSIGPVQIAGEVVGTPGALPGQDGGSVRILSASPIMLSGAVLGGAGAAADDVATLGAPAIAGAGGRGGEVVIMTQLAPLTVTGTAIVASGEGGAGGSATATGQDASAPGDPGGEAVVRGGAGGDGGDLVVFAAGATLDLSLAPGVLRCGDGGPGGDATAVGGQGGAEAVSLPLGPGGGVDAQAGDGGASGSLYVPGQALDADGDLILSLAELQIVGGGGGGGGGGVSGTGGENGTPLPTKLLAADCFRPNGSQPGTVRVVGATGGDGWVNPMPGGFAFARGIDGPPGAKGGNAVAIGGNGGSVKAVGVSLGPISLGYSMVTIAAQGGIATAIAGSGGAPSGDGGDADATGGNGGSAPVVGLPNGGGYGGDASAYGGHGRRAPDCCNPPQANPHNGGNGGSATATGGNGGSGSQYGGDGGDAYAKGGFCGNGGDGNGPSAGGVPGPANPAGGTGGTALIFNGSNGSATGKTSGACTPGKLCAPECSNGVKTLDPAAPIEGVTTCDPGGPRERPCALTCPAGDLAAVRPIFADDESGLPIAGLPRDRYGIEADAAMFIGGLPTDEAGQGLVPFAAPDVSDLNECGHGYILACGTYVYGPFEVKSVDLDASGGVDQADVDILAAHLGGEDSCYDFDDSGLVDYADLALMEEHLGHSRPGTAVGDLPSAPGLDIVCHPNPFNPRTTVSYSLPLGGAVRLQIVDLLGRPVLTLVDEVQRAGQHAVSWNGRDARGRAVAAGVYLVVLESAQGRRSAKLAVIN